MSFFSLETNEDISKDNAIVFSPTDISNYLLMLPKQDVGGFIKEPNQNHYYIIAKILQIKQVERTMKKSQVALSTLRLAKMRQDMLSPLTYVMHHHQCPTGEFGKEYN